MGNENATVNVLVSGLGRMGQLIVPLVNQHPGWKVVAGFDQCGDPKCEWDFPVYTHPQSIKSENNLEINFVFDFSSAEATRQMYRVAQRLGARFLTGTTKLPKDLLDDMKSEKNIPIFQASNMSYDVFKFIKDSCHKAQEYAKQGYDIDVVESHHVGKADAPSGTAWALAEAINEALGGNYAIVLGCPNRKRSSKEIRITSFRMGNIPGTHKVLFSKGYEIIPREHKASDRSEFAEGAIKAAEFLLEQKPGYYNMNSIYGSYSD